MNFEQHEAPVEKHTTNNTDFGPTAVRDLMNVVNEQRDEYTQTLQDWSKSLLQQVRGESATPESQSTQTSSEGKHEHEQPGAHEKKASEPKEEPDCAGAQNKSIEGKGDLIALRPDQRARVAELAGIADESGMGDRAKILSELNSMAKNRKDRNEAVQIFNANSENWRTRIVNANTPYEGITMEKK